MLEDVPVPLLTPGPPPDVTRVIREAEVRIDRWLEERGREVPFGFVPSDFERAWAVLTAIRDGHLATGSTFLEWGSGFGVVAVLAALLDYDAYGIEIDGELVNAAEAFADDLEVPVSFARGSFVPDGGEPLTDAVPESSWLVCDGRHAYEDLGITIDDCDVVYAYPWPGEEEVMAALFDAFAARGALLVTWNGIEDMHVRRKAGLR